MYEEFLRKTKMELVSTAWELLQKPLPELTEELFALFETCGNRVKYEAVYFGRRKFLTVFGCLALWMKEEGEKTFAPLTGRMVHEKLQQVLFEICEEECWALPAHVNRAKDPKWRVNVDLFASETAGTLAELAFKLKDVLSPACVEKCQNEALRRVVEPFFATEAPFAHWETCEHNWNAVCVGNIGSAALYLYQDSPERLEKYISRVCRALTHYVDGFAEDGTCMEGLGYYAYGMGYFVNFAEQLYEYTAGRRDLLRGDWGRFGGGEEDKRYHMAKWWSKCYFASGRSLSFSDGSSNDRYRMGLACVLKRFFTDVQIPGADLASSLEDDHCYRFVPMRMDIFATKKLAGEGAMKDSFEPEPFTILPDAQWCLGNSVNGCFTAVKGGHNAEPHNHNDVGSFLYGIGSELFFTDLGAGEYVKEYFGEGRYDILCNRSRGHNVPLLDGGEQKSGRAYGADRFAARNTERTGEVFMELAGAYEAGKVKCFERSLFFDKETGELVVEDYFVADEALITENFVTQYEPELCDNTLLLRGKKGRCRLTVEGYEPAFYVRRNVHSNHEGQPEDVYRICFDVKIADSEKITIRIGKQN